MITKLKGSLVCFDTIMWPDFEWNRSHVLGLCQQNVNELRIYQSTDIRMNEIAFFILGTKIALMNANNSIKCFHLLIVF
jgi:hypothetical protein